MFSLDAAQIGFTKSKCFLKVFDQEILMVTLKHLNIHPLCSKHFKTLLYKLVDFHEICCKCLAILNSISSKAGNLLLVKGNHSTNENHPSGNIERHASCDIL